MIHAIISTSLSLALHIVALDEDYRFFYFSLRRRTSAKALLTCDRVRIAIVNDCFSNVVIL